MPHACADDKTLKKALTNTDMGAIMIVRRIAYLYKIRTESLYGQFKIGKKKAF